MSLKEGKICVNEKETWEEEARKNILIVWLG
jgi:hypothetical protein